MSAVKNEFHEEIEQRADYADCHNDNEFFERLDVAGVDEITWSKSLNNEYANWQYFNLK